MYSNPNLFDSDINDLIDCLDQTDEGTYPFWWSQVPYSLYADNLVLVADRSDKLQSLLKVLSHWCLDNYVCTHMVFNPTKTKVMHFMHP